MSEYQIYTKDQFFEKLEAIDPRFDGTKSLFMGFRVFSIFTKDGNYTSCGNFYTFCSTWNNMFKDVIAVGNPEDSFPSGKLLYIKWKEDVEKFKLEPEEVVTEALISLECDDLPEEKESEEQAAKAVKKASEKKPAPKKAAPRKPRANKGE